ncbi:FAD-binding protein [Fodinicurvata halophila]|uniref:FAD-binding protein n=1 Tax=Fodinicurvata halophila TaxID=1419723 RepID=UPI0036298385
MTEILRPDSPDQLFELVNWAVAEKQPLKITGSNSKDGLGRPVQARQTVSLSAFSGIRLYEPEELVLSAGAGTPVSEIRAALLAKGQDMAFEPPDLSAFYGHGDGEGTLGGLLACNLSGPRRIKSGAARDHFLGFTAVTGRGEAVKSGGRVVKNVTGYDLSKLLAGSHGTLGMMTEVTLKVLPVSEKLRTVLVYGLDDRQAVSALSQALGTPHEVSAAAHLPAATAARMELSRVSDAGRAVTAVRVEGPEPSALFAAMRCAVNSPPMVRPRNCMAKTRATSGPRSAPWSPSYRPHSRLSGACPRRRARPPGRQRVSSSSATGSTITTGAAGCCGSASTPPAAMTTAARPSCVRPLPRRAVTPP